MHASKTLYALAALVILVAVWAYLTPIDISVRARGIVRPEGDPIRIVSEAGGRILKVHVTEGSAVRAGDTLVQLDTREAALQIRSLESRIHFTELRLAELDAQLSDAESLEEQSAALDDFDRQNTAALESTRLRFARADLLLHQGLISRQAHDESRAALAQTEAEADRLSRSSDLKRAEGAARLRDLDTQSTPLRAELSLVYHQLEQARLVLDRLTITSPATGRVTSLAPLHNGEFLPTSAFVAAVAAAARPVVIESFLPTADRAHVSAGQSVRLQSDAFPPDQYNAIDGAVLAISPDARFNEGLTGSYRVLIAPAPDSPSLHLGMTFQVHFITRQERLLSLLFQKVAANFANHAH